MLKASVAVDVSGIDAVVSEAKKRNITLKGAKAAGKILKLAARAEAPKRSGATRRAQGVKAEKGKKGATTSYAVQGVKKKFSLTWTPPKRTKSYRVVPAFIDHLIQLGTKPHSIAKGAKLARKGKAAVGQTGKPHPGARPNPYRKRAWDQVKDRAGEAAVEAMGEATQKVIDKQAAKIAAKARDAKGK